MALDQYKDKIKARTTVLIDGLVDFSAIENKISGAALERANQFTRFPSKDPYYKLTLVLKDPDPKNAIKFDPNNESEVYLGAYIASRVYESKKAENAGKKYLSLTSKGSEIRVFKKDADNKLHRVQLNGNELAQGLEVQAEVVFFETKFGAGVGLNSVIITAPEIKTYESNAGVKGYDMADDVISLPSRKGSPVADVTTATGVADEMPISDGTSEVSIDEEPVGSTSAPSNSSFDSLLAQFKAGQN